MKILAKFPPLTYANLVATLALFIALGGTSYAAITVTGKNVKDGSLTGKDLKNKSIGLDKLSADVRAPGAKGDTGAQGARGERGDNGSAGAAGEKGETGPTGASVTSRGTVMSSPVLCAGPDTTSGSVPGDGQVHPVSWAQPTSPLPAGFSYVDAGDCPGFKHLIEPDEGGVYSLSFGWGWNNLTATGRREIALSVNGSSLVDETVAATQGIQFQSTSTTAYLNPGDEVEAVVVQDSGASVSMYADSRVRLAIQKIAD